MKKRFLKFLIPFLFLACDDGDIIVTSFDFDNASLIQCGGPGGYVFFKINNESAESISLLLVTNEELFVNTGTQFFEIDESSNKVNYRKFDDAVTNAYFCSEIPPVEPQVTNEFIGESGQAKLVTMVILDDRDELDEDPSSDLDTDSDGLLNYYDDDDDGDNVPTVVELGVDFINGTSETPRDTDGDQIFDYLDEDDDGDGVLTRYEDLNQDLDPTNDITDGMVGPDYLNPEISTETIIDSFREHTYNLYSSVSVELLNLVLVSGEEKITQQSMDFGNIEGIINQNISLTPDFPD
jgi:hypothetical protein